MKKLLIIGLVAGAVALTACSAYHSKQPVNPEYYKKTQSVAWPEATETTAKAKTKTTTVQKTAKAQYGANSGSSFGGGSGSAGIPGAPAADPDVKWEDPKAVTTPKVAVPEDPGLKLQCTKKDGAYTCRKGVYICGKGCQSDGSNCREGICLEAECDNVMGQKWELVRMRNIHVYDVFGCKHPTYDIKCTKSGSAYVCNSSGSSCGWGCNANGTQCEGGDNNCWDRYR